MCMNHSDLLKKTHQLNFERPNSLRLVDGSLYVALAQILSLACNEIKILAKFHTISKK